MTATLNLMERYRLLELLEGVEGNLITIRMVIGLKERLGFTPQEVETHIQQQEGGRIRFDPAHTRELEFAPAEVALLRSRLETLDAAGKVTESHSRLFDLLCPSAAPAS